MLMDSFRETAVTIDHDSDEALVDTTVKSVATLLTRCEFEEFGDKHSLPYRRFLGQADQVRFRLPKGKRKVRGAAGRRRGAAKRVPRTPSEVDVAT